MIFVIAVIYMVSDIKHSEQLLRLSNLRRFCAHFKVSVWNDEEYTARLIDMLDRSPNLEDLRLSGTPPNFPLICPDILQVIEQGRWPSLKRLTLSDLLRSPGEDALNRFISAHPNLERFYITTFGINPRPLTWTAV